MGSSLRLVCAAALLLSTSAPAWSQSISEMIDGANQQSAEIRQLMTALQTADQLTQFKLVESLLAHEDKALVRLGREHALFSTNPVMQNVAIVSALNENEFVRMTLLNPQSNSALKWAEYVGGNQNGTTGSVVLSTGEYDGECWIAHFNSCRFIVVGTSVRFAYYANGGQKQERAQSVMHLGADGVLRGDLLSDAGVASVEIDLKE